MVIKQTHKMTHLQFQKPAKTESPENLFAHKKKKAKFLSLMVYALIILITISFMLIIFKIIMAANN